MLFVPLWREIFAVEHCDLWPFSLCPLCLLISVMLSTVNLKKYKHVIFFTGVVVNIHPSLMLLASSEGGRLDPTCAKNGKREKVAFNRRICCFSQWKNKFICLLLSHFSGKQKKPHYGKQTVWTRFPVENSSVDQETWSNLSGAADEAVVEITFILLCSMFSRQTAATFVNIQKNSNHLCHSNQYFLFHTTIIFVVKP